MENPITIEDFPDYVIDRDGSVYNAKYNFSSVRSSHTREGAVKITLRRDGKAYTKSLARLVAKAHLYNDFDPEIFNTPIHLDNDLSNNHVDNLAWRPRWFAVKYQSQYWLENVRYAKPTIMDTQTKVIYTSLIELCQEFGLLWFDIIDSCIRGKTVFPTWKVFQFVD
jgi:hypothetical protein